MIKDSSSVMSPSGENGRPSWRADGSTSIKTIETQPISSHFIQVGCLKDWMVIITGLPPPLVICHDQNKVRFFSLNKEREKVKEVCNYKFQEIFI